MKKILFIVGSHRKQSFNHQLAQQIIEMIQDRAQTTILNYKEVRYYMSFHKKPLHGYE